MDAKLALVQSIDDIKDKITLQEYNKILENLAKIGLAVDTNNSEESEEKTPEEKLIREREEEIYQIKRQQEQQLYS